MVNRLRIDPRKEMQVWRTTLRKLLRRRGLALLRHDGGVPPTLRETLHLLREEAGSEVGVCCLDGELQTQTDLLAVFPAGQVTFLPDLAAWRRERPASGWRMLVVDAESVDLLEILADDRTHHEVETLIVRVSLGHFWVGGGDLGGMTRSLRATGFKLRDALGKTSLLSVSAPSESMVLVYQNERSTLGAPRRSPADARVTEALVVLSPPLVQATDLRRLAGRGSFSCASGVLNPGALRCGRGTILLARCEELPWAVQKKDETSFMTSARPVLMELNAGGDVVNRARDVTLDGDELAGWRGARVEDFRLFRFREEIWTNCAITSVTGRDPQKNQPLKLGALTTKVGLARFDPATARLTCLGTPRLDRPTHTVEKNWAMFEADGGLHLIYSFNPYRLLRAANWPSLEFTTVHESELRLPTDTLPPALRNSINPVPYDEQYFLHIVHTVFPVKRYAFWAVLIDRATLLPVKVGARPLVCGWQSAPASIIYVTAVVVGAEEIEIYGGLNDSAVGRWTLRRDRLDAAWLPLA